MLIQISKFYQAGLDTFCPPIGVIWISICRKKMLGSVFRLSCRGKQRCQALLECEPVSVFSVVSLGCDDATGEGMQGGEGERRDRLREGGMGSGGERDEEMRGVA